MKIKQLFLFLSLFSAFTGYSQVFMPYPVPIVHNGKVLAHPFAGGLDTPQFSLGDIDQDGVEDLFVFDRKTGQISLFLSNDVSYSYTEIYTGIFPEIDDWVLLRDFNKDGLIDLFKAPKLASSASVEVWKGIIRNDELVFEKVISPYGNEEVLSYLFFGNYLDVYVARTDIPVIQDIDNDGDLDILAFESGGGTVNFFKNLCVEEGLPLDSFKIELNDRCWGKFRESIIDEKIILSDDPDECAQEANFRHAGSTMSLIDLDGDHDLDIILGDSEYGGLKKIENGSFEQAFGIDVEEEFPSNDTPVDLDWFLGTYILNIDLDEQEEMIVAPNTGPGSNNHKNVWLYKDSDPGENVEFSLVKKDFLIDEMIDWGSQVYPCFVDFDQDGLMDMVLGISGLQDDRTTLTSRIVVYKNTGAASSPEFQLWDDDYLGLSGTGLTHLSPTFGDLNNDGSTDLIIGQYNGKLLYYENKALLGEAFEFEDAIVDYMSIDVGFNALPLIMDLNGDGLNDLLIGNARSYKVNGKVGSLAGFINAGIGDDPVFNPDLEAAQNQVPFANIALHQNPFQLESYVRPYLFHGEETSHLILGSARGTITMYDWHQSSVSNQKDTLFGLDLGDFCAPSAFDLKNSGYINLLLGTDAGGLKLYSTPIRSDVTLVNQSIDQHSIMVFPNPASSGSIKIRLPQEFITEIPYKVKLYDSIGKHLYSYLLNHHESSLDVSGFQPGIYHLVISSQQYIVTKKIILSH